MSRDVEDENYYVSKGGKVPVKWTAPEVCTQYSLAIHRCTSLFYRHFITRSTLLQVMCGALVVSCMRYGVSDTSLSNFSVMQRLDYTIISRHKY